jgi:sodium/potassium-transporting ATPase subunit alpha
MPDVMRPVELAALCGEDPAQRFAALASGPGGLSDATAAARLARYGPNSVERDAARSRLHLLASNFIHPLALLLWFGATMAFAAAALALGIAIVAVVVINGVFATIQEERAERVVEALLARSAPSANVIRGGRERVVPAKEIVPGDLVALSMGAVVPADCVLVQTDSLSLDLSLLTGESVPVTRSAEPDEREGIALPERTCIAPAGAAVLRGTAEALVFATGARSTLGRIEALLVEPVRGHSLLERQVARLSRWTAVIAVSSGTATLVMAMALRDTGLLAALTFGTGVIVALVPEGLLPLLTVCLAFAARRMATRGALVRRLSAIEVVGATTVICTDKTGTLTQNTVSVLAFVSPVNSHDLEQRARVVAATCNDARIVDGELVGDPIERALLAWVGADEALALRTRHQRIGTVPFDAQRRYMRVDSLVDGIVHHMIKGAPEAVAALVGRPLPAALAHAIDDSAARGERVLLLAEGAADAPLELVGLLRLHDPPRTEVPAALEACRRAGVRVIMLTGDHPSTARAVATGIGLCAPDAPVLDGSTFETLDDDALSRSLRDTAVFARTTPEQKLRIVRLLRAQGEIVTVTGDGVNDAPALRMADVGIAMGRRGTEVAKQASDIVLLDENFATIVSAIEEGRTIKANIRRFVSYVFTSNVAELVPFLVFVFASVPLPLSILQVLAIDLGTDMLPALALGLEPASSRALDVPPEPPTSPLLHRKLAVRTFLFYGVIEAALGMGAYLAAFWSGAAAAVAATLTFLGIVGGQIGCVFAQRDGSMRRRLALAANPWLAVGLGVEIGLVLALLYIPEVAPVLSMAPVHPAWLLTLPIAGALLFAADSVRRAVHP